MTKKLLYLAPLAIVFISPWFIKLSANNIVAAIGADIVGNGIDIAMNLSVSVMLLVLCVAPFVFEGRR